MTDDSMNRLEQDHLKRWWECAAAFRSVDEFVKRRDADDSRDAPSIVFDADQSAV